MSLIVALNTGKSIFLVSDTKISYNDEKSNPYLEGISKIVLIGNKICVAFAGDVDSAIEAINGIPINGDLEDIKERLVKFSSNTTHHVEFIVCSILHEPIIWEINKGQITSKNAAWIGNENAFAKYQSYFSSYANPESIYTELTRIQILQLPEGGDVSDPEIYSNMFTCMGATIDSQEIETVGGFIIPVMTHKGFFQFGNYLSIFRKPLEQFEIEKPGGVVSFGDAGMGSFAVNFAGQNTNCFAIHLEQGKLGILFEGSGEKILKPSVDLQNNC